MKLVLAGGTGLVGGKVAAQARERRHELVLVSRRSLGGKGREVITDFSKPCELPTADAAICALGTTIKKAGSRAAFYAVDHDAVLNFAASALAAGIDHFLVVTAAGARVDSPVYYSRVKGEIERDVAKLGFRRVDIARPGLLLGRREESRPVEALLQATDTLVRPLMLGPLKHYMGIKATAVAAALLQLCEERTTPGVYHHGNQALDALARQSPVARDVDRG